MTFNKQAFITAFEAGNLEDVKALLHADQAAKLHFKLQEAQAPIKHPPAENPETSTPKTFPAQLPLFRAIYTGHVSFVELFLTRTAPAYLEMEDEKERTALHYVLKSLKFGASEENVVAIAKLIVGALQAASIPVKDFVNKGEENPTVSTVLHTAVKYGSLGLADYFLTLGARPIQQHIEDESDQPMVWSTQMLVCNDKNESTVLNFIQLFLKHDIRFKKTAEESISCMEFLTRHGHVEALAMLAQTDALTDLFISNAEGKTPLAYLDPTRLQTFEDRLKETPVANLRYMQLKYPDDKHVVQTYFMELLEDAKSCERLKNFYADLLKTNDPLLIEHATFYWGLLWTAWEKKLDSGFNTLDQSLLLSLAAHWTMLAPSESDAFNLARVLVSQPLSHQSLNQLLPLYAKVSGVAVATAMGEHDANFIRPVTDAFLENTKAIWTSESCVLSHIEFLIDKFCEPECFKLLKPYFRLKLAERMLLADANEAGKPLSSDRAKRIYASLIKAGFYEAFVDIKAQAFIHIALKLLAHIQPSISKLNRDPLLNAHETDRATHQTKAVRDRNRDHVSTLIQTYQLPNDFDSAILEVKRLLDVPFYDPIKKTLAHTLITTLTPHAKTALQIHTLLDLHGQINPGLTNGHAPPYVSQLKQQLAKTSPGTAPAPRVSPIMTPSTMS